MKVYQGWENIGSKHQNTVVALGNFDGVHSGHQQLISNTVSKAKEIKGTPVVFTFYPHPSVVLKPQNVPLMLLTQSAKQEMIEALGVEVMIKAQFNRELSKMTPEDFVVKILRDALRVRWVFVGYNYTFGFKGEGTPELLQSLGIKHGFNVHIIPSVLVDGKPVSSTLIRHSILEGDVKQARMLLGYYPWIEGEVIAGERRGRTLGFPTANLRIDPGIVVPANGVYSVEVKIDGSIFPGVANIGTKPTFHNESSSRNVEVHLLDFDRDLYGKTIKIFFTNRLREEKRFSSIEELVRQIELDIVHARERQAD